MTLKGMMLSVSVSPKYFLKGYNKRLIIKGYTELAQHDTTKAS
jgi:hypothetical protein